MPGEGVALDSAFERRQRRLEPAATVGNPPRDENDRKGGDNSPPQREDEIRQQAEDEEYNPEDFLLHIEIVGFRTISES